MKKRLVTSALPYVNNIPHLGNLVQVLSADVFARFCRLRGYETRYICGTDEYGTATETKALELGVEPSELCDRYHEIHAEIYRWFRISFDIFGRTTAPAHRDITQGIFTALYEKGYVTSQKTSQLYSEKSKMFLADRYVVGTCPHCSYEAARGDQCERCGTLLDPTELVDARSTIDDSIPVVRETEHLYINLPALCEMLEQWMEQASKEGMWAKNAIRVTKAWIRDGLKQRAITRDLRWGIPVPLDGYRDKVFYVWFDAPIGYISITATLSDEWESWWKNPDEVELYQFVGKDNIAFHSVIFPATLLGTGERWTMVHHISSSEYLNYEGKSFSKSAGTGIFADQAKDTGIPVDVWRFYLMHNRPDTSDYNFSWLEFQQYTNGELIGNFSNLVNRTFSFVVKYLDGRVGGVDTKTPFWKEVRAAEERITESLERAQLKPALREILRLCDVGNQYFQSQEPWRTRKSDLEGTRRTIGNLVYLIRDLVVLIHPYLPDTSEQIASFLGLQSLSWDLLGAADAVIEVKNPKILFRYLEDEQILALRERYSGVQEDEAERFAKCLDVRSAKVLVVEAHPDADKLYVLRLDDGSEEPRTIVSGLVAHYSPEELTGRMIVLVANLKAAKIRGVRSEGMLLAADEGEELEVLDPGTTKTGLSVLPRDTSLYETPARVSYDDFSAIELYVAEGRVMAGDRELCCDGSPIVTARVLNGSVS